MALKRRSRHVQYYQPVVLPTLLPKELDEATARECAEMFDVGFCMGARIVMEVLLSVNFA